MGQNHKRQPAGIRTGGQFATQRRDEASVGLDLEDRPPAPSFPVEVPNTLFRPAHAPSKITVFLQNPPPAPQIGCDWTDPTRDPDAHGDLDRRSMSEARRVSVEAVTTAAAARIRPGAPAPVDAVRAIDDWSDWARERWKATGDTYYPEFDAGLTAGKLALIAQSVDEGEVSAFDELERWTEEGTINPQVATLTSIRFDRVPIDDDGIHQWVDAVELSCGGDTPGGQDGALLVGRLVGDVPSPAPPRRAS